MIDELYGSLSILYCNCINSRLNSRQICSVKTPMISILEEKSRTLIGISKILLLPDLNVRYVFQPDLVDRKLVETYSYKRFRGKSLDSGFKSLGVVDFNFGWLKSNLGG